MTQVWERVNDEPEAVRLLEEIAGKGAHFTYRVGSLSGDFLAHLTDGETIGCGQSVNQALKDAAAFCASRIHWSARCECYRNHNSASGRCNTRNVTEVHHEPNKAVLCESCRRDCVRKA